MEGYLWILATWGGWFYFFNKLAFVLGEGIHRSEGRWAEPYLPLFEQAAWFLYLVGLPAWVVLLWYREDFIVSFIEMAGAPSMLYGLFVSLGWMQKNTTRERLMNIICVVGTFLGIGVSFRLLGIMTRDDQWLEVALSVGFLTGLYLRSHGSARGYLFFAFMNLSNTALMYRQGHEYLALQQFVSLIFMIVAYYFAVTPLPERSRCHPVVEERT